MASAPPGVSAAEARNDDRGATVCERCGYRLDGLGDGDRCPECGKPVAESTVASGRDLSPYERRASAFAFWQTTAAVILSPQGFYRRLRTRVGTPQDRRASQFRDGHLILASLLSATAAVGHYTLVLPVGRGLATASPLLFGLGYLAALASALLVVYGGWWLAARLTAWEADYRGMRLPRRTARRVMCYHAAQATVAAAGVLAVVAGYRTLLAAGAVDGAATLTGYLLVLAGAATVAAVYLFVTYWGAMRSVLRANV